MLFESGIIIANSFKLKKRFSLLFLWHTDIKKGEYMIKKLIVFVCAIGVILSYSMVQANPIVDDLYGNWSGIWTLDTLYYNNNGTIESYAKQADGTWTGDGLLRDYFDSWLYPNDPKQVTLSLHAKDASGYYGSLHAEFSRGNYFDGNVTGLILNGNIFNISIVYESGDTSSIYGTFDGSAFSDVRFDETNTPQLSYVTGQGTLDIESVPEPVTIILFGFGLAGVAVARKKLSK